jgi:predicted nucleic acid-binding protein
VIILDPNVLSALMRTRPDAEVIAWLDQQPAQSVWITAITLFEARSGLGCWLRAGADKRLNGPLLRFSVKTSKAAYWTSTGLRLRAQLRWPPSAKEPDDQWTCVTLKSRA